MPEELNDRVARHQAPHETRLGAGRSRDRFEIGALEVPLEHDLLTLAQGLKVDRSVLQAIADAMGLEMPPLKPAGFFDSEEIDSFGGEIAADEQPDLTGI